MTQRRWAQLFFLFALTLSAGAQKASSWRIYTAEDGLRDSRVTAVTLSPRGRVWMKHGDTEWITRLNGYQAANFSFHGNGNYRLYEGKAGRVWSIYAEGVQEFSEGRWINYPIAEVQREFQNNAALRSARPFSLFPIEKDRVLLLLPDRLLEFNATSNQTSVIRLAADTGLGKFSEMIPSRDDGLWIAGAAGVAKVNGPLRSIRPDSKWDERILEAQMGLLNLQRPVEDDRGGLCVVAESVAENKRVLAYFDGQQWSILSPGEVIRQGWRGADGTFWGCSINSLFYWDKDQRVTVLKDEASPGQYFDVALGSNGVFWLGTSEGLFRYSPALWRTPREVEDVRALVHAMVEDNRGRIWFTTPRTLMMRENEVWKSFALPVEEDARTEKLFQPAGIIFAAPTGDLILDGGERLLQFDPAKLKFSYVSHPSGGAVKPVGALHDGRVCVQVFNVEGARGSYRLETYDGRVFQALDDFNRGTEIYFLLETAKGDLWVGGNAGLSVQHEKEWHTFTSAEGDIPEGVTCAAEIGEATLWFGGRDKIWEYNGKKWSIAASGFDTVHSLLKSEDGSIWVASNRGLHRFHNNVWADHGVEEGLPSGTVYDILEDKLGTVWAGTTRGLAQFHPEADPDPPRVLGITSRNDPTRNSAVELVFNAVDKWKYTPSRRLLYSYRVDEQEWTQFKTENAASVYNLAAGIHQVKVRVMDRNWNLDSSPVYEFAVIVPWYRETKLLMVGLAGLVGVLFFAALAVNRHLKLLRSYAEVEKIVSLRTRQLEKANAELLQSHKMNALGTLTAGIAHDFNNILSIIKGSAQIIETNLEDREKVRTRVDRIKIVVDQGAGIVKGLLGFSRTSDRTPVWCDINSIVEDTIKLLGDRFMKDVEIQFEWAPSLPAAPASRDMIQQMLLNLIFNAADALAGRGSILLRTGELKKLPLSLVLPPAAAPDYVFIAVKDEGCGIAPDILPRIFEPFFTTKALSQRRGTGLGLSMVYELAKEMGFGISVETAVGKGSTFSLILPVKPKPSAMS